jgi:hypothetical protein
MQQKITKPKPRKAAKRRQIKHSGAEIACEIKEDNARHREDFERLLDDAVRDIPKEK